MKYEITKSALKFSIAGIFIPGFSMIVVLGLQMLINLVVKDCEVAWKMLFVIMTLGAIITPIIFGNRVLKANQIDDFFAANLWLYNLSEYIFLQVALGWLYSSTDTLCYRTDGQNGLQFVFTAWIGLIIILIYSFILDLIKNNHH